MKQITITFLLLLGSLFAFSQTKFNTGIYAEGGLFSPQDQQTGFSGGGRLFVSSTFAEKFSISLLGGYRYKSNKSNTVVGPISDNGRIPHIDGAIYPGYGNHTYELDFKQHSFLPDALHPILSYTLSGL